MASLGERGSLSNNPKSSFLHLYQTRERQGFRQKVREKKNFLRINFLTSQELLSVRTTTSLAVRRECSGGEPSACFTKDDTHFHITLGSVLSSLRTTRLKFCTRTRPVYSLSDRSTMVRGTIGAIWRTYPPTDDKDSSETGSTATHPMTVTHETGRVTGTTGLPPPATGVLSAPRPPTAARPTASRATRSTARAITTDVV